MKRLNHKIKQIGLGLLAGAGAVAFNLAPPAVQAQERDPFRKPVVVAPRAKSAPKLAKPKPVPPVVAVVAAPTIEKRIENYRLLRQRAAEAGVPAPKPTSALTIDEIEITGIFRTPRGYAAMVEATPLKLSYTIYPGEQFYNGQLVAIEDNRAVFRRTTQWTNGKTVDTAENKGLKLPGINDLSVPRVESAANAGAPTVNPTTTVPANSAPAAATNVVTTSGGTVQTAENKIAAAGDETKPAADAASETGAAAIEPAAKPKSAKRPAKKVQPRSNSRSAAGKGTVAPRNIIY